MMHAQSRECAGPGVIKQSTEFVEELILSGALDEQDAEV